MGGSYNGLLHRTLNPGDVGSNPMPPTNNSMVIWQNGYALLS